MYGRNVIIRKNYEYIMGIEGSKVTGACAILEIAFNGIFITTGNDEEDYGRD